MTREGLGAGRCGAAGWSPLWWDTHPPAHTTPPAGGYHPAKTPPSRTVPQNRPAPPLKDCAMPEMLELTNGNLAPMTACALASKYFRTLWPRQGLPDALAGKSYDELIEVVRSHSPRRPPIADDAAAVACAWVGSALGSSLMKWGARARDLRRLLNGRPVIHDDVFAPDGELFDHTMTFSAGRQPLAILTRPYLSSAGMRQACELARHLDVWTTASERCSWYPGATQTFVLARPGLPSLHALGFYRLGEP